MIPDQAEAPADVSDAANTREQISREDQPEGNNEQESGDTMIRRIKLIHILLFSFTVTTVVLIAIILGSWRLVISESEESARNRMQNMLGDTVAAVEERITGLEDGSRIAGSFPEIRDFVAGDEQVRFRLKNSVRAELTGLIYYEPGAVSAYLRTADGAELSACPESGISCPGRGLSDYVYISGVICLSENRAWNLQAYSLWNRCAERTAR